MTTAGVFRLLANDGKADKIIMANEYLKRRLVDISCARAKDGRTDTTPTLLDIERTHVLFVNAHFKPFAAIGYEYNKVRQQTGSPAWNNSVTFSIPQFGDFFHDMVVNVTLGAVSATAGVVPALPTDYIGTINPTASDGDKLVTEIETNATVGVYKRYTYEYVDAAGNLKDVGSAATNFVRYCEYPGERLFKKIKFEVNGNPLDDYSSETLIFHRKFKIQPNKKLGWARLMGQEVPLEAYSDFVSLDGASTFDSAASNLVNSGSGNVSSVAPQNGDFNARKIVQIVDGPQTPKAQQPELELWHKLIFWFNCDVRLAVPSVSIPYGQRFITLDIEQQSNIVFVAPGNLYLRLTQEIVSNSTGTAAGINTSSYKKIVTMTPVLASGSVVDTTQQISNMDLYINNIFVNPEIHDIYIKRIGFSLIRVHKYQQTTVQKETDSILLNQLKWPVETMFIGIRPRFNVSAANPNQYKDWHRLTAFNEEVINVPAKSSTKALVAADAATEGIVVESQSVVERLNVSKVVPTIDTLKLTAHGITLFDAYKSAFYRDYLPYHYGAQSLIVPEDEGALMLPFCIYPGTYQPSGHLNVSRTRELYLDYKSSYIGSNTPGELHVQCDAINFLLISDGSAILRYTT